MRTNSEYLTSNTAIAFPFEEDAAGFASGFPKNLIADALFSVPPAFAAAGGRLYLMRHTLAAEVLTLYIGDGDQELFDIAVPTAGPGTWTVRTGHTAYDPASYFIGTLVLSNDGMAAFAVAAAAHGTSLPFTASALSVHNPSLLSLGAYNLGPAGGGTTVTGAATLNSGHNIAITHVRTEDDGVEVVSIDAGPGLGLGRWECDNDEEHRDGPPGLAPDHGDIAIEGDRCYSIVPHGSVFQIQGRCQACCTCDDYAEMADVLKGISAQLNAVKEGLDQGRDRYEAGVKQYNEVIVPGLVNTSMTVTAMRGPEWATGKPQRGAPNWIRIVITIMNNRRNPVNVLTWGITYTSPAGTLHEDVTWEHKGRSGKANVGGTLPELAPGEGVAITILASTTIALWNASGRTWQGTATATVVEQTTGVTDNLTQTMMCA